MRLLAVSYLLICLPAAIHCSMAPDRPAAPPLKQPAPLPKMPELVGDWVIGSRYTVQQLGASVSIEGVSGWSGRGTVSADRHSLLIDWTSPSGDAARAVYQIESAESLKGHWWYLSEEIDGAPPKDSLRGERIVRPEPDFM